MDNVNKPPHEMQVLEEGGFGASMFVVLFVFLEHIKNVLDLK